MSETRIIVDIPDVATFQNVTLRCGDMELQYSSIQIIGAGYGFPLIDDSIEEPVIDFDAMIRAKCGEAEPRNRAERRRSKFPNGTKPK